MSNQEIRNYLHLSDAIAEIPSLLKKGWAVVSMAAVNERLIVVFTTGGEITHMCPSEGTDVMPCCGRPPFEVREDRMTLDPELVTCWFLDDIRAAEEDLVAGRTASLVDLVAEFGGETKNQP